MRVVEEREDKFEVDPDWVMPQLMGLVPDGGRLDQEVLRLDNTYFDAFNTSNTASVWPIQNARCHVIHAVTSTPPGQRPPPTKSAPSAHTPRAYPPGPAASAQLPSSKTQPRASCKPRADIPFFWMVTNQIAANQVAARAWSAPGPVY